MTARIVAKPKADILIVDDNQSNLHLLNDLLSNLYTVRLVSDGLEALRSAFATPPDLIILDILMPGMDGYAMAARLKANPRTSEIPIIFISALSDVDSKVRSFTAGGVDYIVKPFHVKEVLARLQIHLTIRDLQRQLMSANTDLARQNELLQNKIAEVQALQSALREQVVRDPLTGAFNRRYLFETLDRELARSERELTALSLVMIDVDHFKLFNDNYGHQVGDLALSKLVWLLNRLTRKGDVVCRYGGEEFVVLMPNSSLKDAKRRAEEWRLACERMPIEHQGRRLGVTISQGVVSNHITDISADKLLAKADQAMYKAKTLGRNRTFTLE